MREPLDVACLARVPVFAGVDFTGLADAARRNAVVHLARDEVLFHRGEQATGFYFVESGRIQLTVANRMGSTTTVEIIGADETFGEAVVFLAEPFPVTASALVPSTVYFICSQLVDAMLSRDPRTARRLLANLSMRNHRLVADVAALTLESATQRVVTYLLRQVPAPWPTGAVRVELPDAKRVVADRLSLTPESLSRALRRLADRGLVDVNGPSIRFDPHALAADVDLAEQSSAPS